MGNDVNYAAPIVPLDYPYAPSDDIRPCHECLPWFAQVFREDDDDADSPWVLREWHAHGCPVVAAYDAEV